VLRPGGIYAANIIDYPPLDLARSQLATFAEVFEYIAVFGPASRVSGQSGGNLILLASDSPFPEAEIIAANETHGGGAYFASGSDELSDFVDGALVLTDDFAPTDQLLTRFG
jgi:hypothetical protein